VIETVELQECGLGEFAACAAKSILSSLATAFELTEYAAVSPEPCPKQSIQPFPVLFVK